MQQNAKTQFNQVYRNGVIGRAAAFGCLQREREKEKEGMCAAVFILACEIR